MAESKPADDGIPGDDLQELLDQLDDDDQYIMEQVSTTAKQPEAAPTITPIEQSKNTEALVPVTPPPTVDIAKTFEQLDAVTNEVLQACRSDRQEAQDVIGMLRNQIDKAHNNNSDPARVYVEGLVKAIEVKSNINMTAVKIIEANAKMLAATKAGTNIQLNNSVTTINDQALDEILNDPISNEID